MSVWLVEQGQCPFTVFANSSRGTLMHQTLCIPLCPFSHTIWPPLFFPPSPQFSSTMPKLHALCSYRTHARSLDTNRKTRMLSFIASISGYWDQFSYVPSPPTLRTDMGLFCIFIYTAIFFYLHYFYLHYNQYNSILKFVH